jgi:hypothetical protein
MIRRMTHQLEELKADTGATWRQLCRQVPYSSLMRWRGRQRQGLPLWQSPGPKKTVPLDDAEFSRLLDSLQFGPQRTHGIGELYQALRLSISRRQLSQRVQDHRQDQLDSMKRLQWLWTGLAWSIDATEYDDCQITAVQDLASRYQLQPLVTSKLDGRQIAGHLEALFRQHGAPLLLKRDNGSPFNNQYVDEVLARYWVLPLNNPPHFPRYNGAREKGIRDFKERLRRRWGSAQNLPTDVSADWLARIENSMHELNHLHRRCLKGRTACAVFHDGAQRLRWTVRQRQTIFRLLLAEFGRMIGTVPKEDHRKLATLWRVTVQSWLRRQGLISVRQNQQPKVSTNLPTNWSHN